MRTAIYGETRKIFKSRLNELMIKKDLRQVDLVKMTGINKVKINQYVNGNSVPMPDSLCKISNALGVSAAWLVGEEN